VRTIKAIPTTVIAINVVGCIGNSMAACQGAVTTNVMTAIAHTGIASPRANTNAISYLQLCELILDENSTASLPWMPSAMFGEPLLAHPAKRGFARATQQPHSRDSDNRGQTDDHRNGEPQHKCSPLSGPRRIAIVAFPQTCVCSLVHMASSRARRRLCTWRQRFRAMTRNLHRCNFSE